MRKHRVVLDPNESISELPNNLSPGIAHMLLNPYNYLKTIAVVIVSLAEKGYLSIIDNSGDFIFVKEKNLDNSALEDEKAVFNTLFDGREKVLINYHSFSTVSRLRGAINRAFISIYDRYYQGNRSFVVWHSLVSVFSILFIVFVPQILGLGLQTTSIVLITIISVVLLIATPFSNRKLSKEGHLIIKLLKKIKRTSTTPHHSNIAWSMVFEKERSNFNTSSPDQFAWFTSKFSNERYEYNMFAKGRKITPEITVVNEMSYKENLKKQKTEFVPWLSMQLENVFRNSYNK